MQKETVYGLAGLVVGVLLTIFIASSAVNNNNQGMMRMMGMSTEKMMGGNHDEDDNGMSNMMNYISGKKGDEFDKAFILSMIEHHEGAIDMAEEAEKNAKHQEIKDLAKEIINAQTKEIDQMKTWQKDWGYK